MAFNNLYKNLKKKFGKTQDPIEEIRQEDKQINASDFEKQINYTFFDKELLSHSLRHRSVVSQSEGKNTYLLSNERLEFLGDAVLDLVVSEFLYKKYQTKAEGDLSKMKSLIISRKVLKDAGDRINLGNYLILGKSEEKTGGRTRFSIISNAFESVIAGVYFDGGYKNAAKFINSFVLDYIDEILSNETFFNYKSTLLEYAQKGGGASPIYQLISSEGPDHKKTFTMDVQIKDIVLGRGVGKTKKEAEQLAAAAALEKIKKNESRNS